jgi:hypothetical protein
MHTLEGFDEEIKLQHHRYTFLTQETTKLPNDHTILNHAVWQHTLVSIINMSITVVTTIGSITRVLRIE